MITAYWIDILQMRNQRFSHMCYLENFSHLYKTTIRPSTHSKLVFLPVPHPSQFTLFLSIQGTVSHHMAVTSAYCIPICFPRRSRNKASDDGTLTQFPWLVVLRLCSEPGVKLGSGVRSHSSTPHWWRAKFPTICSLDCRPSLSKSSWSPNWWCHRKSKHERRRAEATAKP